MIQLLFVQVVVFRQARADDETDAVFTALMNAAVVRVISFHKARLSVASLEEIQV